MTRVFGGHRGTRVKRSLLSVALLFPLVLSLRSASPQSPVVEPPLPGATPLAAPIVGMALTPSGAGHYLVSSDGGVFAFGDAAFQGSMGGRSLAAPVVGMSVTPSGAGYYLVSSDGGVFAFGDAAFLGSMGGRPLAAPVVGMSITPSGAGYYLTSSDGEVFPFGDAVPSVATPTAPSSTVVPPTTVPAATSAPAAQPALQGFPLAGTTGIAVGVAELTASGGFTASVDGAVYSNLDVVGNIDVTATNVVFNSVRVRGARWYAVHVEAGASATFNNCDVAGAESRVTGIYVEGTATLNACHVHDSDIDVYLGTAGHATINDSLLDDLWGYTFPDGTTSHDEAIKFSGGGTATVTHSSLKGQWGSHGGNGGGVTGAVHNDGGTLNVSGSLLGLEDNPQSYVVYYVGAGASGSVTNSVFEHLDANHLADNAHALSVESAPSPAWSGNIWVDGQPA